MINLELAIKEAFIEIFKQKFTADFNTDMVVVQQTRKEIEGDYTINVFPLVKAAAKAPEALAHEIGTGLVQILDFVSNYNVIKGFLNLTIADTYWLELAKTMTQDPNFGIKESDPNKSPILIEYSSPNTNKPLHLGHVRNNLLGYSIAEILKADGNNVVKVNLVNDRGIHICKSMLAWEKFSQGATPQSTNLKGDHLVGKYYVEFDRLYKSQIAELVAQGVEEEEAAKQAPAILEAQEMLRQWEAGNEQVVGLWKKMNSWVYEGFDATYQKMGVDFDKIYYESETYLLGKSTVQKALKNQVLFVKEGGSVWADLTDEGLDQKLLLRADGTSVYMTQDIGTAKLRMDDYQPSSMLYVVGNEQNYHFDVLKIVLQKMGYTWAKDIYHISYGMVELPHGKMKSREGTVVDADDLMDEVIASAEEITRQSGKMEGLSVEEAQQLFYKIGMGALKFFLLKVDPKKKMLFNPAESIDFNGNTGPFVQYTHARIQSVLRKSTDHTFEPWQSELIINDKERNLIKMIGNFPEVVHQAALGFSPALMASYVYDLAKEYNQFYHDNPILKEENKALAAFRLDLSRSTAAIIRNALKMLGIQAPNQM